MINPWISSSAVVNSCTFLPLPIRRGVAESTDRGRILKFALWVVAGSFNSDFQTWNAICIIPCTAVATAPAWHGEYSKLLLDGARLNFIKNVFGIFYGSVPRRNYGYSCVMDAQSHNIYATVFVFMRPSICINAPRRGSLNNSCWRGRDRERVEDSEEKRKLNFPTNSSSNRNEFSSFLVWSTEEWPQNQHDTKSHTYSTSQRMEGWTECVSHPSTAVSRNLRVHCGWCWRPTFRGW